MECSRCGAMVSSKSRYCDQCGAAQLVGLGDECRTAWKGPRRSSAIDNASGASSTIAVPTVAAHAPMAERRQLTVMFCDLVGSTALSSRLDPEDLSEVIGMYQSCVADTVARFGGFVARVVGDGTLVYFGYPEAVEDDAERAVNAGLATVSAVSGLALPHGYVPQVRVGIATGLVVIGHLMEREDPQAYEAIGETPNLAARLQGLAGPNEVAIAHDTRKLVADLFDCRDRGTIEVKGFGAPVQVWQVLRASGLTSRSHLLHTSTHTPLVGRAEELAFLKARWEQARRGNGQVVLLLAEPGLGKSRLVVALREHLESEAHTCISCFCSPHHQDSALYPMIGQIERAAGFQLDDTAELRMAKLASVVPVSPPNADEFALLAELLSLPLPDRGAKRHLSSQEMRRNTFDLLIRQIESATLQMPLLMVFEDAHWSDATSLELLDLLLERVPSLPLLLVITSRSVFSPAWIGRHHVAFLGLNHLNQDEGAALIRQVLGHRSLRRTIVDEIVEHADGVPLFLEELTKAVLETGVAESEAALARASLRTLAVPTTLHASLMARLDRLGPATKEIACVGAAIGREFSYDLLAAVMRWTDAELEPALDRLVDAGLVFRRGTGGPVTFLFKHGLVQDAAYGTLLRSKRLLLHARIADALQQLFPQLVDQQPELLARHLTEAAKFEDALQFWCLAADRALRSSAYREVAGHCTRGLQILESVGQDDAQLRTELMLQLQLGIAQTATLGPAAPAMFNAFDRARQIAEGLHDQSTLAAALLGLWAHYQAQAQLKPAIELAEQLVSIGGDIGDDALCVQGHVASLTVSYKMGMFDEAWQHFERGIALHRPGMKVIGVIPNYADPGPDLRLHGSFVAWVRGYPQRAKSLAEDTIAAALETGQPYTITHCTYMLGHLAELQGDWAAVRQANETTIELASQWGFRGTLQLVQRRVALVAVVLDQDEDQFRIKCTNRQPGFARALHDVELAHMCGSLGVPHRGLAMLDEALAHSAATGSQFYDAEVLRAQGQLLEILGRHQDAEGRYLHAIDTAKRQRARMWELRAATNLARMWVGRGDHSGAFALLAPVLAWFTEGFETLELRAAMKILQELRPVPDAGFSAP
jgi:class 3 adenylate cyclase/tetratricopeptide (TPR) repeat protein